MRLILQFCLLLLVLLGAETHAWGKVDVGQNIASGGLPVFWVDCTNGDAPPALITQGEPGPWGYEPAPDVCNGPNLYAYVKQNPWTAWDPDGLKIKQDYREEKTASMDSYRQQISDARAAGDRSRVRDLMRAQTHARRYFDQKIKNITETARAAEHFTRAEAGSINDEALDDEQAEYQMFNALRATGSVLPLKFGEHVHYGEYAAATKELAKETALALAFAGMGKALAAAGRLAPVADDTARYIAQGFSREQAAYLAQTYKGMGHHFMPRRWGLPNAIGESSLNVLKPPGMSRGAFYELHFTVDPKFFGTRLPASVGGGTWSGSALGLQKAVGLNRVWQAAPFELKNAVGSGVASSLFYSGQ